jgi:Na+/H+ antiporter NhaC
MQKVNTKINWLIFIAISVYVVGITAYTWLAPKVDYETRWDRFYFMNENFVDVCVFLLCGLLVMVKPLKILLIGFSMWKLVILCFSVIKFLGYSNIVLYKVFTLVTVLILIIYVSCIGIYKE